ncbi:MAG TPA: multiheme c-type cytochrome, partial [Pyrinomonadaceae bacterium]|nr:multiheme c-type cytochrome [Pyrinomonadaceae bacterium]
MSNRVRAVKVALALAFASAAVCLPLLSRAQQMDAPSYGGAMPWRPNKPFAEAGYLGAQSCAKCHEQESATQHSTAMGRALETVAEGRVLRSNPRMTFRFGPYTFQIERRGEQSIYSVTDGTNTVSEPILYSFGQGKAGQTYIYRRNGAFHESRVSYYRDINGLDFTIGYERKVPPTLEEALGRAISMDEARSCFACHSTASVYGKNLQLDKLMPGVSCEACHGPGRDHVLAMEAKQFADKKIFNPGRMGADELTQEFCGS